ncbi:MAG: trypsin-like peptidase domain-containing protein [Sphaerospermopsis sp. SIO1G1]|nr:trypsin-like peptidase domain-containing protein [Sphaerospermopsis sp. SIO1G1]
MWKRLDFNPIKLITCVGGLSVLLLTFHIGFNVNAKNTNNETQTSITQLSPIQLQQQAAAITVKVISTNFLGSGILLKQQDNIYTILTNAHVLAADEPPYKIVTPDGQEHQAEVLKKPEWEKYDLATLTFSSQINYSVAVMGEKPNPGDEVLVVGFPVNQANNTAKNLTFTTGNISLILDKALEGGYQIGYTNQLDKGMSGGALLNNRGELIGVNGMHAYPIWDIPSVFIDGTPAVDTLHQKIIKLSWAVPIKKLQTSP